MNVAHQSTLGHFVVRLHLVIVFILGPHLDSHQILALCRLANLVDAHDHMVVAAARCLLGAVVDAVSIGEKLILVCLLRRNQRNKQRLASLF